jgi:ribosomal subunit interface protein
MSVEAEPVPVEVTSHGTVGRGAREYAREKVAHALNHARRPVLSAHVVLERRQNPAARDHAIAEASANIDGQTVRAKTAAPTMSEAVDDLEDRLRRQLVQLKDRNRTRHRWTGIASTHEWRHGDLPRPRLPYYPRSEETREVVRRKSFASTPMTVDEAAYEMDLLDHDFFLYCDAESDHPALVHHLPEGGYAVRGVDPGETVATVTHEPPPPTLTDVEARARLEADGEPFVFYLDDGTGEGRVLYHRYDGHYGLVGLNR